MGRTERNKLLEDLDINGRKKMGGRRLESGGGLL